MATRIKLEPTKSYANEANAVKAVEKMKISDEFRYIIYHDEESGRCWPVFIGEKCVQAGLHFRFHVMA